MKEIVNRVFNFYTKHAKICLFWYRSLVWLILGGLTSMIINALYDLFNIVLNWRVCIIWLFGNCGALPFVHFLAEKASNSKVDPTITSGEAKGGGDWPTQKSILIDRGLNCSLVNILHKTQYYLARSCCFKKLPWVTFASSLKGLLSLNQMPHRAFSLWCLYNVIRGYNMNIIYEWIYMNMNNMNMRI